MRRRISILVSRDPAAYHGWLVEVFGLTPGEVTYDPEGRAVHAELFAGDGGAMPATPEHAEERLVRLLVELLHELALNVRLARVPEQPREASASGWQAWA